MYMGIAPTKRNEGREAKTYKSVEVLKLLRGEEDGNNFYVQLIDAFLEGKKQRVYEVLESNYEKAKNLDAHYLEKIKEAKIRTWNDRIRSLEILEKAYEEAIKKDGYAREGIEALTHTYQAIREIILTPYRELSEHLKAVLKAKNLNKAYTALRNRISVSEVYHLLKDERINHLKHKYGIKERNIELPSSDYQQPAEEEKYRKVLEIAGLYQAFIKLGRVAKRNGHIETEEKERKAIESIKHVSFIYVPDELLEYESQSEKLKKEIASIYDVLTQKEIETSKLIQKLENLKASFPVEHKDIYEALVRGIAHGLSSEVNPKLIYEPNDSAREKILQIVKKPEPKAEERMVQHTAPKPKYAYQMPQAQAVQPITVKNEKETSWLGKLKNAIKSPWKVAASIATLAAFLGMMYVGKNFNNIYEKVEQYFNKPTAAVTHVAEIQQSAKEENIKEPLPSLEELYIQMLEEKQNKRTWEWNHKYYFRNAGYLSITTSPDFNPSSTSPK